MNTRRFRLQRSFLRDAFAPRKPRRKLAKISLGMVALGLLAALIFLGVFVGAAMLIAGALYKLWRIRHRPIAAPGRGWLTADYRVLGKQLLGRAP